MNNKIFVDITRFDKEYLANFIEGKIYNRIVIDSIDKDIIVNDGNHNLDSIVKCVKKHFPNLDVNMVFNKFTNEISILSRDSKKCMNIY